MPRVVVLSRRELSRDERLAPVPLVVAETEHVAHLRIRRCESYNDTTKLVVNHWDDTGGYREVVSWLMEASYDAGRTWETINGGTTGPEQLWIPTGPDPDGPKRLREYTEAWARLRPQQGRVPRLVRLRVDAKEPVSTEIDLESFNDGRLGRVAQLSSNSVAYVDSANAVAAGASSVTSGSVTPSGANPASFAVGISGGSSSVTISSFTIDGTAATAVTGATAQATGGIPNEQWWYHRVGVSGAHTATVTFSGTVNDAMIGLVTLNDVDQTTAYDNVGTEAATYFPTDTLGTSATSAVGARVLDCCAVTNWTLPTWTGTPDTANVVEDVSSGETIARVGHEDGAASVTIGYDWTESAGYSYVWFNVREDTGGGGGPSTPQGLHWIDRGVGVQHSATLGGMLH